MSITTKLHLILILTIVGVTVYMFLLYKEVRMFEHEVRMLRSKLGSLEIKLSEQGQCMLGSTSATCPAPVAVAPGESNTDTAALLVVEESDDMSVTSNEIQDLISNIQQVDEQEQQDTDVSTSHETTECVISEQDVDPTPPIIPASDETVVHDDIIDNDDIKESILRSQMNASSIEAPEEFAAEELQAMKLTELKALLKKHALSQTGSKQDLISRYTSFTTTTNAV